MKKIFVSAVMASLLTACGGGGDNGSATPVVTPVATPPAVQTPAVPSTPTESTAPVSAPPVASNAVRMTNLASINTNNTIMLLNYSETNDKNLTLVGNNNKMWFAEGLALSTISLNGTGNTIVFMAGTTVTSLTVSAGSTVYLPLGSSIKVLGTGATVKYTTN